MMKILYAKAFLFFIIGNFFFASTLFSADRKFKVKKEYWVLFNDEKRIVNNKRGIYFDASPARRLTFKARLEGKGMMSLLDGLSPEDSLIIDKFVDNTGKNLLPTEYKFKFKPYFWESTKRKRSDISYLHFFLDGLLPTSEKAKKIKLFKGKLLCQYASKVEKREIVNPAKTLFTQHEFDHIKIRLLKVEKRESVWELENASLQGGSLSALFYSQNRKSRIAAWVTKEERKDGKIISYMAQSEPFDQVAVAVFSYFIKGRKKTLNFSFRNISLKRKGTNENKQNIKLLPNNLINGSEVFYLSWNDIIINDKIECNNNGKRPETKVEKDMMVRFHLRSINNKFNAELDNIMNELSFPYYEIDVARDDTGRNLLNKKIICSHSGSQDERFGGFSFRHFSLPAKEANVIKILSGRLRVKLAGGMDYFVPFKFENLPLTEEFSKNWKDPKIDHPK